MEEYNTMFYFLQNEALIHVCLKIFYKVFLYSTLWKNVKFLEHVKWYIIRLHTFVFAPVNLVRISVDSNTFSKKASLTATKI